MKTAVSIPDDVFEAADKLARRLKISRSALANLSGPCRAFSPAPSRSAANVLTPREASAARSQVTTRAPFAA